MQQTGSYSHNQDKHYLVRAGKDLKCVCQMCNCGKHKCPRQQIKGSFETSYNQQYQNFTVVPLAPANQYRYAERHYNPQVLTTNYKETYITPKIEQPLTASRMGNVAREILRSEPFVGDTSYKAQYKPFQIQNVVDQDNYKLADSRSKASIKFQGESSYKAEFHELPIPKIDRYRHPQYKQARQFQGSSSYKDDFPGFKVQLAREKAVSMSNAKPVRFEGSSTYNNHYGTFKVVPVVDNPGGCKLDSLQIPSTNYLNSSKHVYYDQASRQFI